MLSLWPGSYPSGTSGIIQCREDGQTSGFPTGADWNQLGSGIDLGSGVLAIIRSMEKARGLLPLPPEVSMSEPAGWLPEAGEEPRIPAGRRKGPSITSASTAQRQQQQQGAAGRKPGVGAATHRPAGKGIICRGTPPPNHRPRSPVY